MFVCPLEKQLPGTIIGLIISVNPSVRPHEAAIPFRTDFLEISFLGFFAKFYGKTPTKWGENNGHLHKDLLILCLWSRMMIDIYN
jgi:hypothetical protein